MIHCLVLHYWSRFQKYLTPFWGVMAKKPPKVGDGGGMYAAHVGGGLLLAYIM